MRNLVSAVVLMMIFCSCKEKIKVTEDEIYSRHLQQHINLTIISTPIPKDKSELNLLLLNDGQDMDKLKVKHSIDSLYANGLIKALVVVAVHAGKRMAEYGVAGSPDYQNNGVDAEKYSAFIDDELYPFVKKRSGVRKFNSVTIAGCSLGGLSAFDIAWDHADKIDKVGIFSGSFWFRNLDAADPAYKDEVNRIELAKIKSSRKKPKLEYWFYAGTAEETGDRDKDGIIDVLDDTKDMIALIKSKNICPPSAIIYKESAAGKHDYADWSRAFPEFLIWAVGK